VRLGLGRLKLTFRAGRDSARIACLPVRGLQGGGRRGWCEEWARSGWDHPTFHTISARPSKQLRMVESTLGVYNFGLIFVSARTNKRHHHPL
jgi:hypothetical protein